LETQEKKGAFIDSLTRTNKGIRKDRAEALVEATELLYKRRVEDVEVNIKTLKRDMENMLDLSPDSAISLKVPSDFDAAAYVEKNCELALKLRNEQIKLRVYRRHYERQFIDAEIEAYDFEPEEIAIRESA